MKAVSPSNYMAYGLFLAHSIPKQSVTIRWYLVLSLMVSAACSFAEHLPERRKMMQQWADYLDKLKAGADVIPLRGQAA